MKNNVWKPQLPQFRTYKKNVFYEVAKTGQFIYQIGESENLRKRSPEVNSADIKTPEFQKKIAYIKQCMCRYRKLTGMGRGITAVQVGIPERFSVIYMPEIKGEMLIIINPIITRKSPTLLKYPEICMSANPLIAKTVRPAWIEFEYRDEKGQKQYWNTKDSTKKGRIYNRVFQHEIDHMDGTINIDRVNSKELIYCLDPKFYDTATFEKI